MMSWNELISLFVKSDTWILFMNTITKGVEKIQKFGFLQLNCLLNGLALRLAK